MTSARNSQGNFSLIYILFHLYLLMFHLYNRKTQNQKTLTTAILSPKDRKLSRCHVTELSIRIPKIRELWAGLLRFPRSYPSFELSDFAKNIWHSGQYQHSVDTRVWNNFPKAFCEQNHRSDFQIFFAEKKTDPCKFSNFIIFLF